MKPSRHFEGPELSSGYGKSHYNRIGFVTAVQLGLDCLEEIERMGGVPDLLITLSDEIAKKKSGRIYLDDYANRSGVDLIKTTNINEPEVKDAIKKANLDYLLVIGWSQIVGHQVFPLIKYGLFGMHPTLLPQGRGRAPIPWTILKGLTKSGVSMFEIRPDVDSGDIVGVEKFNISSNETSKTLYEKARKAHIRLIRHAWPALKAGTLSAKPQDETKASYWPKRSPDDGIITEDMTLEAIDRLVRALTHPYPGAFLIEKEKKLIIWDGVIVERNFCEAVPKQLIRENFYFMPTQFEWL